jgi:xanthine/CO dehydrogenase XdhC/CoxF family maturation factor
MALITVLATEGSTYSKAGSQMLVNGEGHFQGMLSGGCLEGDLAERSKAIIDSGVAECFTYDLRGDDDVFGLGVGCEGAITILIQALSAETAYEPLSGLMTQLANMPSADLHFPEPFADRAPVRLLAPLRLLILGAGQDADPLLRFAEELGWNVTVSDHRPAAVDRLKSNNAAQVVCTPVNSVASSLELDRFDAVVIMSHNLSADRSYLTALADTGVSFVGLLGPPHRRDRLLGEIGEAAVQLGDRLHAPVGRQIGGRGPAAIALEIAAELQSVFFSSSS